MNCREALRLLYDYIDKEASEIDSEKVNEHLKMCRHCMARYEFEQMFKTFVIDKGTNPHDNSRLKASILSRLDAADAAGEVGVFKPPFKWVAVALASAASLILCFIAAMSLSDFHRRQTEIVPFIKAHFAEQVNSVDVKSAVDLSDPFEYLYQNTGIRLSTSDQMPISRIHSVRIDTIFNVPFGHIELTDDRGLPLSVFVTSSDIYQLPDKPSELINGYKRLVSCCKKCNVVGITRGDIVFVLVSDPDCKPATLVDIPDYF